MIIGLFLIANFIFWLALCLHTFKKIIPTCFWNRFLKPENLFFFTCIFPKICLLVRKFIGPVIRAPSEPVLCNVKTIVLISGNIYFFMRILLIIAFPTLNNNLVRSLNDFSKSIQFYYDYLIQSFNYNQLHVNSPSNQICNYNQL